MTASDTADPSSGEETMNVLRNKQTNAVVAGNVRMADNFWTRFRGLMLRSRLAPGEGLAFTPAGTIHMMFMRFSIDAVFCDRDGRVTKVARNVRPWIGGAMAPRKTELLIELPSGGADAVQVGDELELVPATAN